MTEPPPHADDRPRQPALLDAALFLAFLGLYALTRTTTLQGHDNPEWVTLSVLGGTPHPPGYPLYALLLRAWGVLPLGTAPGRAALLSAVLTAAALVVLARALTERSDHPLLARVATCALGLSLPVWRAAGVAEVPPLLLLNAAALLWLLTFIDNAEELLPWHGAALGALLGVGVAHHHSLALLLPLVFSHVVWPHAPAGPRRWGLSVGAGLLAGTVVVVGVWAVLLGSATGPQAYHFSSLHSLGDVARHLLRTEYGTFSSNLRAGPWMMQPTWDLLADTATGLHVLALLAVLALTRRRTWPLALCWLLAGPWLLGSYTFTEAGVDTLAALESRERFHVLPLLLVTVVAHDGLAAVAQESARRRSAAYRRGLLAVLLGCTVGAGLLTLPDATWRGETAVDHTLRVAVRSAPAGALVLVGGDAWTMGWDLVSREEGRTDLLALDWPRSVVGRRPTAEAKALLARHCPLPCLPPRLGPALVEISRERPVVLFPAVLAAQALPPPDPIPLAAEGLFLRVSALELPSLAQQAAALAAFQDHQGIPTQRASPRGHAQGHAIACWAMPWLKLEELASRAGERDLAAQAGSRARQILGTILSPVDVGHAGP
jgi:hypothetical protein